jgi:hypothetical protein
VSFLQHSPFLHRFENVLARRGNHAHHGQKVLFPQNRQLRLGYRSKSEFKASYFPSGNKATIFINGGYVLVFTSGQGVIERISKRPVFYQFNFLHYNPGRWWKYFSDIYCVALILVTITGLLLVKGRNGITKRGAILTLIGIVLPLLFLFIYK